MSIKVRAAGAVMGALIGDALAVGPHWYYDLDELRRDYGDGITGYTDPKPHRYHAGLKAGQLSQAGIITTMLLRSVVDKGGYEEDDFAAAWMRNSSATGRQANEGTGYTSQSIREAWRRRVEQKKSWKESAVMPIPPKLRNALWCWLRAMPKIRQKWQRRSDRIAF
jgi:ADP-ribosylglycohydrolase